MKRAIKLWALAALLFSGAAAASEPAKRGVLEAVLEEYPPAVWHRALETAYEEPQADNMRGYAVVERGGIPAERARHFISWSDYDYRGVVLHMDGSDRLRTRRGSPYTWLSPGDVMAVAGVKLFRDTVYLKLISAEVYVPQNRREEKRHSRVTVMLGFKFPRSVMREGDGEAVVAAMSGWVRPFKELSAARAYAEGLVTTAAASDADDRPAAKEEERIRSIEERIEAARRDLESAERDLRDLKKSD